MLEFYPSRQLVTVTSGVLVLMTGPAVWSGLIYLAGMLALTMAHQRWEEAAWAEPSSPLP